jgi:TPR repeat protein
MVNTSKLVVIAFLVGLNIILCSVFTGLHLIYVRRFAFYESKKRRKQSFGGKVIRHEHISMNHDDSFNNSNTHLNSSKTIRSSTPPNSLNDLHIHSRPRARHSNDISTIAEAHLKQALRWIPFERDGPFDGNGMHRFSKDSDLHRQKRKKVESTKLSKRRTKKNNHDKQQGEVSIYIRQLVNAWSKWLQGESATVQEEWKSNHTEDGFVYKQAKEALYHLEQAAHLGNHHAQNMLANTLASGILPVTNILGKNHSGFIARTLLVPTDFAYGGEQLAQAIILWHMSAMQGNIEAAMALGFRHEYSAAMGQYPSKTADTAVRTLITNEDVTATLRFKRWDANNEMSNIHISPKSQLLPTDKGLPLGHSANPTAHYGVLGTCESAMLYYESAANTIMDELEASPLRGKISPAIDRHNLAQIQMRGTSSALEYTDKPDESEEAIQYYRMRASRKNANPDVNAAYTLAQYYHYGIRGVQQSMSLALHYYEIAADHKHWEAAGQAGKFHLWSIGIDENARNLKKAYQYFKMGMPGGIGECRYRFEARSHKKARALDNNGNMDEDGDLDSESDLLTLCDHPCINGMGLLYVFGVPDLVS